VVGSIKYIIKKKSEIFEENNGYSVYTSINGYEFGLCIQRARIIFGKGWSIPESQSYFELNNDVNRRTKRKSYKPQLCTSAYKFLPELCKEFKEKYDCSVAEIAIKSPSNNIKRWNNKLTPLDTKKGEGLYPLIGGLCTPTSHVLSVIYYFDKNKSEWTRDRSLTGREISSVLGFDKEFLEMLPKEGTSVTTDTLYDSLDIDCKPFSHVAIYHLTNLREMAGNVVIPQISTSIIKHGILKVE
jgi:hypothetical protein